MSLDQLRARAGQSGSGKPGMRIRTTSPMSLTFAELEQAAGANPEHPKSVILKKILDHYRAKLDPDTVIAVDRKIILAVIDNSEVSEVEKFDEKTERVTIGTVVTGKKEKEGEPNA